MTPERRNELIKDLRLAEAELREVARLESKIVASANEIEGFKESYGTNTGLLKGVNKEVDNALEQLLNHPKRDELEARVRMLKQYLEPSKEQTASLADDRDVEALLEKASAKNPEAEKEVAEERMQNQINEKPDDLPDR